MAGTNGTLLGVFNGPTVFQAFNGQANFPDVPGPSGLGVVDYFQIVQAGGAVIFQVKQNGESGAEVSLYPATWTKEAWLQQQMAAAQAKGLVSNATAAQICAAVFPENYNHQKLDIFQVVSDIQSNSDGSSGHGQVSVPGGGGIIFRLDYAGAAHTS